MKKFRIWVVVLTIMFSVGGVFATRTSIKNGDTVWGVLGTDGSNYVVTELSGTQSCEISDNVCTVLSSTEPTSTESGQEIPINETNSPEKGDLVQH